MATFISIHDVAKLTASTVWEHDNDCSPHITLDFEGDDFQNRGAITLYIGDAVLNARLIAVINTVIAKRKVELAERVAA